MGTCFSLQTPCRRTVGTAVRKINQRPVSATTVLTFRGSWPEAGPRRLHNFTTNADGPAVSMTLITITWKPSS